MIPDVIVEHLYQSGYFYFVSIAMLVLELNLEIVR
jgi:hypothetical protein